MAAKVAQRSPIRAARQKEVLPESLQGIIGVQAAVKGALWLERGDRRRHR
jgi:hypothetical protein